MASATKKNSPAVPDKMPVDTSTPVAKPKAKRIRTVAIAKKPLTEKQELLVMREATARLSILSEKNIKAALSVAAQTNPAVLSALTVCNAVAGVQEPKATPMPWRPLVDVFINNRYFAEEQARIGRHHDQAWITREFRTLTIGGCRQTGKSQLARDIVRDNPKARLVCAPYSTLIPKETDPVLLSRTIVDIDALTDPLLQDIEVLVIDHDGFPLNKRDPYQSLLNCLEEDANQFPAGLQVIRIL